MAARPPEVKAMAQRIVTKVGIADDAEFFAAWKLDSPGMEGVKEAVDGGDFAKARVALKEYFLNRRQPEWRINHWGMPKTPKGKAAQHSKYKAGEDILAHRFSGGGHKVDFGERIDWNYFPLKLANGNPDTEYPLIHYINRFGHLSKTLGPLYWFSHDERYAKEFVYEVTDHVESNPAPEAYIRHTAVWSRLTACGPLTGTWLDGYNYFLPSEHFTPAAHAIMLKGFIQKARYAVVAPDAANRYMIQLTGIYNVGAYFPELKQAGDFREFAVRGLTACVEDEFYPDCMSKELCPGYHGGSRQTFARVVQSARLMGYEEPEALLQGLERGYDFYPKVATPLGGLPQFGDTWGKGDLAKVFRAALPLVDKPVYRWFATAGKEGRPPEFTSTRLPWAGFYVMRSGWDKRDLYLCLDAGPLGTGHWHEDFGNFECYAYGEHLIGEMGIYSYTTNRWNRYFRSSLAHNVVLVDGLSQDRACELKTYARATAPRKQDWHSDAVFDLAWGLYEGKWVPWEKYVGWQNRFGAADARKLAAHLRQICFVKPDYWIITDRLHAPGEHTYSQLFHIPADRSPAVLGRGRVGTQEPKRPNILLVQADPIPAQIITGQEDPPQGWHSTGQGKLAPAPTVTFEQTTKDTARYDTLVLPLDIGQSPHVKIERVAVADAKGQALDPQDVCALRITTPKGIDYYVNDLRWAAIAPAPGLVKQVGPLLTDACAAVIRLSPDGAVRTFSTVGASLLELNGKAIREP
jgi:hypothetical protein